MLSTQSQIDFTDKKFLNHLAILVCFLLLLLPLYWLYPSAFFTLSKTIISCLAFYLIVSSFYTHYMTDHVFLPTMCFFYGFTNILQLFQVVGKELAPPSMSPLFFSIKTYYVGRVSCAVALIFVSYFYVHHRQKLRQVVYGLFIFCMTFLVASFFIFDEAFIMFTRQHTLSALYFNLANHLIMPLALCFTFCQLYKVKDTLPPTHKKVMILFVCCSAIMESIDILYFVPLTSPLIFNTYFKLITLSLLLIAQIDISVLRPFQEFYLKRAEVEKQMFHHSKSLSHYTEKVEQLQTVLYSQSNEYEKMISIFPIPFIVCVDSNIYQVNPAALKLFNMSSPHDLIGTNILAYIKDAPDLHAHFNDLTSSNGILLEGEGVLVTPYNHTANIEYLFTCNSFYTPNTVICILRDITSSYESKNAQQELFKHQLKLRYFSSISHDIKTPINIIYSALQMQSKSTTLPECTHYTDMMHSSCLKLLKLLNNLLDLTKIDNQMFSTSPQVFNIVDAIESLCEVSANYMQSKEIDYIFDTDNDEKYVYLDPQLIERIVLNLLSNAVKYTPNHGHLSIYICDHDSYITIHFKDTGIGIAPDKLDKIFDRYTLLSQNYGARDHSAGMGLSIVNDLLQLMNGSITCESTVGEGSEFIVTLPTPPCSATSLDMSYNVSYSTQNIKVEFCDI
ncbi:MAG: ATP-binding protein [Cellulosilyticaceae bacterium]